MHLCGVRGSTPAPGAEFVRYGGHTSCVAIVPDGAARARPRRRHRPAPRHRAAAREPFTGTIMLSHLHWDHVHGLPFFAAGDRPGARVTSAARAGGGRSRRGPAGREDVPAALPDHAGRPAGRLVVLTLSTGVFEAEGFTVEARKVPHKGGRTFGYRVSDGQSTIAYLSDHCPTARAGCRGAG